MNSRTSKIFWRVLKVFGVITGIVSLLFSVAIWIISKEKDEWLLGQIQAYMRQSQSGELKIGKAELLVLRNFPDVTLELDSIDYFEHVDSLRAAAENPILHADQVFLAVKLLPLLERKLEVTEINLINAQINIEEDSTGTLNISRALSKPARQKKIVKKTTPKQTVPKATEEKKVAPKPAPLPKTEPHPPLQIDLQNLFLSEILITWKASADPIPSIVLLREIDCEFSRQEQTVTAEIRADQQIRSININGITIPSGDVSIDADLTYEIEKQRLSIDQGEIHYDVFSASVIGTYEHAKKQYLDLQVDASSNDLQLLSAIIKPEVLRHNPDLLKNVDVYIKGRVHGEVAKQLPQVDLNFGVKDLDFKFIKRPGSFQNIGFDGKFLSGSDPDFSKAILELKNIRGQLPGGYVKGHVKITDFVNPYLRYDMTVQAKMDGYDEIFRMDQLKKLKGKISIDAHFDGLLKEFSKHDTDNTRRSAVVLDNISFEISRTKQMISGLSGKIENNNNVVTIQEVKFSYGNNDVLLNASIENFVHFLFNQNNEIKAYGKWYSQQLFTKDFILDTLLSAEVQDRVSDLSFDFQLNTKRNEVATSDKPDIVFNIQNLNAKFDKLPDIRQLNTIGVLSRRSGEPHLSVEKFQIALPIGTVDVTGDLVIPKKDLWKLSAHVRLNKFPWTYVRELVAELREGDEPKAKNILVSEMDIVNSDVYLDATLIPFPFDITGVTIEKGWASYATPKRSVVAAKNIKLSLENLFFIHPNNTGVITGLKSTKGNISLKQVTVPGMNRSDYNISVEGKDNLLTIDFVRVTPRIENQKGLLTMDISKKEIAYHLQMEAQGADLEYFIERFSKKKNLLNGQIDYSVDLQTRAADWSEVVKNVRGKIEITGNNLLLYGVDVDNVLRKYEKSQNFNLTDLGAVVVAGPVGLAVTKGSDFISLAKVSLDSTQQTRIQHLYAKWSIDNKQLSTEDVAFATLANRIAFNGQIDFGNDSIPGLTIAVIDKNGCSLMDQKLYGKMNNLQTGKLNITKTLLGSVINFVNAVVGKDCKPVYNGRVEAPITQ